MSKSAKEFFNDWWKCIDETTLNSTISKLQKIYKTVEVCPNYKDIFKAFSLCPYSELKVVIIGQDPYFQKDVATGLAFANKKDTEVLSPSLKVIKNSLMDLHNPEEIYNFVPDLESWAKQGVLLLNSALTVEVDKPGSHTMLWRPFISSFIKKLSEWNPGIVYVLFGETAKTFQHFIGPYNDVIVCKHPSYYARTGEELPDIFKQINDLLLFKNNIKINWL